ncbi:MULTISPECIES: acyl carrier protein [unclassified Streptomyces]|uniref:acyl carrier protein n=1 Tax=unclassified Streptomyces TaxID=2593676 RepID=UPI002366A557|nr:MULTISPECIES: acyl carrier protein [unclassified Streptomyces]MDF3145464.1 acyl carrier protein [Streptomyces sp. T21Q-yed]WDF35577.1 acyl carrier protein [Streptomyces sp. T12]
MVVVPPAHAADGDDYEVTLTSSTATTDYDHRTVDLTGTLTRPDGTPVADAPVQLEESVLFKTWNPWGDPIDPTEWETRGLGTVRTDAEGRYTLEDVPADRWDDEPSRYLSPRHEVRFRAVYDTDPTDFHMAFADTAVRVEPVASSLTYRVSKLIVRPGDGLTVTGKVTWPAGHGPVAGTRVFLRQYFESQYDAQTTTDAAGNFTIRTKIREDDREFVVFSAPKDYYLAGVSKDLPVMNIAP